MRIRGVARSGSLLRPGPHGQPAGSGTGSRAARRAAPPGSARLAPASRPHPPSTGGRSPRRSRGPRRASPSPGERTSGYGRAGSALNLSRAAARPTAQRGCPGCPEHAEAAGSAVSGVRGEGGPDTASAQVRPGVWRGAGSAGGTPKSPAAAPSSTPWVCVWGGVLSSHPATRGRPSAGGLKDGRLRGHWLAIWGNPLPLLGVWRATESWRSQPPAQLLGGERAL